MDKLAELLRQGADKLVNLPTQAQRFVTNPQAFVQLLTGKNALPRETGFAAGATGLPPEQGTVLDPNYQAYMQGYEQGEPVSFAAMAAPAAMPVAKALAPKAGQMAEQYMVNQGFMPSLIAYHGTPHTIRGKFDISKVGTGEGAQAYGHGMYFAENPAVAKEYQNMVRAEINGKTLAPSPFDPEFGALNALHKAKNDYASARKMLEDRAEKYKVDLSPEIDALKIMEAQSVKTNLGNLYKVDIPDEYIPNMLDWDKPMNMQSPQILKALKIPQEAVDKYNQLSNRMEELQWIRGGLDSPEWNKISEEAKQIRAKYGLHRSGEELYREMATLAKNMGNEEFSKVAAENLKRQGITGIRYLDEGSRGKARNQTSNFVVFDPSNIKILEQNSKPMTRKEIIEQELEKVAK